MNTTTDATTDYAVKWTRGDTPGDWRSTDGRWKITRTGRTDQYGPAELLDLTNEGHEHETYSTVAHCKAWANYLAECGQTPADRERYSAWSERRIALRTERDELRERVRRAEGAYKQAVLTANNTRAATARLPYIALHVAEWCDEAGLMFGDDLRVALGEALALGPVMIGTYGDVKAMVKGAAEVLREGAQADLDVVEDALEHLPPMTYDLPNHGLEFSEWRQLNEQRNTVSA